MPNPTPEEDLANWQKLFRAITCRGIVPDTPPLWPNPDWFQDQAFIAFGWASLEKELLDAREEIARLKDNA